MKLIGLTLMMASLATTAFGGVQRVPEVDGNLAASAVTLLAGGLLVMRARKK